ncbi:hypothetical protein JI58_00895 [Marinosulfonomonas sp. PRT-SC04]|nr:hypothetical protein JI58_00895 [Marinosulfonomonas sp. PRT-SC04]
MTLRRFWMIGVSALILGACQQVSLPFVMPVVGVAEPISVLTSAPEDSDKCWGKGTTPAVVETVTQQVLVRAAGPIIAPSPDGAPTYKTVHSPAIYTTRTQQKIITPRADFWFEVPCPAQIDQGFIATLQRALKSRGLFRGAVTGVIDQRTQKAVRWYQKQHGLDSTTLSLAAARQLGLIAYARDGAR